MDTASDSSKCELDSLTSADSFQIINGELRLNHLSAADSTNAELSKRVSALELDNERLKVDLENVRIELNAKNAANQGLKDKITELHVEAQISLQERQKLINSCKDAQSCLAAAEKSVKWYQGQLHAVQASKRTLQVEIDTYQNMLKQKHQTLVNITAKWKQLNEDYTNVIQKHREEKNSLKEEIELFRLKRIDAHQNCMEREPQASVPIAWYNETSNKLQAVEEELTLVRASQQCQEERAQNAEEERLTTETALSKLNVQLQRTQDDLHECQVERDRMAEEIRELKLQLHRLGSEADTLQVALLSAKQHREQVEDAIEQLRLQVSKMIAQHKLLKNRNVELEDKLTSMQDGCEENKRLKSLLYSANASLFRRLRQERRKSCNLEKMLSDEQSKQRICLEKSKIESSTRECLRRTLERNKALQEQLKCAKVSEEIVDEGYADSSLWPISLPSPSPLSPVLLNTISDVLLKSKNFWEPVHIGLEQLNSKLGVPAASSCYTTTPPPSPPNNFRSVT
ncbi:hypothetical protein QAD02_022934 [Eretmocerus hayati]|uniref:Uncharacterized protein n=1 Tax=Eretmocerus hayati TaxID=131215 RepID=A0ACC2PUN0_9HYME|nr:hypothetical protein QAD02_022934 [Eretmocerus hayati]